MSTKSAEKKETSLYSSGRVFIAMMLMLGIYCTISMRSHIGVAMVCMVNATAIKENAAKDASLSSNPGNKPASGVFGIESPFEEAKCAKLDRNLTGKDGGKGYRKRRILTSSSACRVFQSIASFGGALVYLVMAVYVDCSTPLAALLLLAIFGFCFGGAIPGSFTSSLCIAPSYTGMIASFTLVAGCFGNILAPAAVAVLVKQGTRFEWSIVFFCVALVNILGGGIFFVYGTAKIQPWAKMQIPTVAATVSTHRGAQNRNNAVRVSRDTERQM
uniref:Uncharacterized protein n=1 Tax=Panagrolaimus sp. JU765 TaxID=591449 RepID=A0AC34RCC1_9BILA